ncbi:hypothetical protein GCM10027429_00850 [Marivirga atlantica]|jgi:hypothetical protein|uniref:Uncharacterized protein n=1 Tax=Marivirga atlantica TaxID=1548457 RepID=A0A937DCZ5_9BACT|nr:hypothetical protein [Marivirga atlantica]MBL0763697.1 hypothetical protein [Marivirga atlantica]
MNKTIAIWFLSSYAILLSGSLLSIGHDFLHATSSVTGIHEHETKSVQSSHHHHGHGHHHHVSDHGNLFKELFTITEEGKDVFTNMVFVSFFYEPVYKYVFLLDYQELIKSTIYSRIYLNHSILPSTPPPDL